MRVEVHFECFFDFAQIGGKEIAEFEAIREKTAEGGINGLYFGL
jgi:hypothetical protein